jgi:hypothetical protein
MHRPKRIGVARHHSISALDELRRCYLTLSSFLYLQFWVTYLFCTSSGSSGKSVVGSLSALSLVRAWPSAPVDIMRIWSTSQAKSNVSDAFQKLQQPSYWPSCHIMDDFMYISYTCLHGKYELVHGRKQFCSLVRKAGIM